LRTNWRTFFGTGPYWFSWALPGARPVGDGVTYVTRSELLRGAAAV